MGSSNTPTGLEVFPVDPETKAPIGATEGANGETIWMATKGHTSATSDAANHRSWWQRATGCPNRRPHTQRRGRARYRPPPRRPTTHGTPSSPATTYRTTRVHKLPAATTAAFTSGFRTPTVTALDDRRRNRRAAPGAPLQHSAAIVHPSGNRPAATFGSTSRQTPMADHARMANRTHSHRHPKRRWRPPGPTHHPKRPHKATTGQPGRMVQRQRLLVRDPDRMAASSRQRRRRRLQMGPPNGNGRIFGNDPARMLVCVLTDARVAGHRNQRPERPNKI